jgi:chromosome segregation ATPase
MNSLGFFIHRIAGHLGFRRERQRWGSVNRETQILKEAEDLLGRLAWPDVRDIDDLSGEYWQILDLDQQQQELREQTRITDERNEELRAKLYNLEDEAEERLQGLRARKSKRMENALGLMREVEQLKDWKEGTKKKFQNLKQKLELMKRHGEGAEQITAELDKTQSAMAKLKDQFAGDLSDITAKTEEIERIEKEVEDLDRQIVEGKAQIKIDTADLNSEVGHLSKQIAELSAKIGALENTKSEFYFQVGHFLSNSFDTRDPVLLAVLRKHRPLVSRIAYFRRSIAYNQRLTRRGKR